MNNAPKLRTVIEKVEHGYYAVKVGIITISNLG